METPLLIRKVIKSKTMRWEETKESKNKDCTFCSHVVTLVMWFSVPGSMLVCAHVRSHLILSTILTLDGGVKCVLKVSELVGVKSRAQTGV